MLILKEIIHYLSEILHGDLFYLPTLSIQSVPKGSSGSLISQIIKGIWPHNFEKVIIFQQKHRLLMLEPCK